jgi:hypothetical protein
MSALRLINETTITSNVNGISITDVFSSDFDIYKVTFNDLTNDTGNANVVLRFINSSGSIISASNYDWAFMDMGGGIAFGEYKATNSASLGNTDAWVVTTSTTPNSSSATMYVFNPYSSSSYSFALLQSSGLILTNASRTRKAIGVLKQTASMTGFHIYQSTSSVNLTTGTIRTYGLRVDNG